MPLDRHKTVRQALQYVDRNPHWPSEDVRERLNLPVWELCARQLFDIANYPDGDDPPSFARATRAQKIILDRLTGTRRMGTNPAVRNNKKLNILDLTANGFDEQGASDE